MSKSNASTCLLSAQPLLQLLGDDPGLVVFLVARPVDKSESAGTRVVRERREPPRLCRRGQLVAIARPEFLPSDGLVAEPAAELVTRAEFAVPLVEAEPIACTTARPHSVDKDAVPVLGRRFIVCALQL